MSKIIIFLVITLHSAILSSNERIFTLKGNVQHLVNRLTKQPSDSIPDIITDADLCFNAKLMPKQGYYRISVSLREPYGPVSTLEKSIEMWDKGNEIIVKTTIDLKLKRSHFPFRWVNILKNIFTPKIENEILDKEYEFLFNIMSDE